MQRKNPFKFTEENFKKWLFLYVGKYKDDQLLEELEIFFNMDVEDEHGLIKNQLSYLRQLYFEKYNLPIPLWKKKELWRDFIYGDYIVSTNYIDINSIYRTIARRIRSIDGRVQHPLRKNPKNPIISQINQYLHKTIDFSINKSGYYTTMTRGTLKRGPQPNSYILFDTRGAPAVWFYKDSIPKIEILNLGILNVPMFKIYEQ